MYISKLSMKNEIKKQLKERAVVYSLLIRYENDIAGTETWWLYPDEETMNNTLELIRNYWRESDNRLMWSPNRIIVRDSFGHIIKMDIITERHERAA